LFRDGKIFATLLQVTYFCQMAWRINWDALGVTTSVLCAIHCAILPLAIASLPVFGINIVHNPGFEYFMIALAAVIGTRALWHGFRRHHQRWFPLLAFGAGMMFLIAKQIWHNYELALLPFALVGIVAAHVLNYRLSRVPSI
jgi:hypothetical protein